MPTDIVIPLKNEAELIKMAKRLGYDTLVMAYQKEPKETPRAQGITIWIASLDQSARWATLHLSRAKPDSRGLLEQGDIDGIYRMETSCHKDFLHHRGSGLNTVLAGIAARKGKAAIFDVSFLLDSKGEERGIILGRISQNIRICRKSKTPMVIASFATNPYRMRAPHDTIALFEMLGMHPSEAKSALEHIGRRAAQRDDAKNGRSIGAAAWTSK